MQRLIAGKSCNADLLGDSAQLHGDVASRVPDANHDDLFVPPLLGGLVVSAVEVLALKSVNT